MPAGTDGARRYLILTEEALLGLPLLGAKVIVSSAGIGRRGDRLAPTLTALPKPAQMGGRHREGNILTGVGRTFDDGVQTPLSRVFLSSSVPLSDRAKGCESRAGWVTARLARVPPNIEV